MESRKRPADQEYPHDSEPATAEEIARSERGADFFARRGLVPPKPRGRPKAARTKVPISLRIDPDTLEKFKATGNGWQARMNEALDRAAEKLEEQN